MLLKASTGFVDPDFYDYSSMTHANVRIYLELVK